MITLKLPFTSTPEVRDMIKDLQMIQSPMVRSAYVSAKDGLAEISVRADMRERFAKSSLDSWFQQSAVKSGMGMFKADNELGISSRIFGGKKNFIRRAKGLISNEEWKECRLLPVYLIGEAPQKGNRKFDFGVDEIIFKPSKGTKLTLRLPKLRKNWHKMWSSAVRFASEKKLPITVSLTPNEISLSFDETKLIDAPKYKKAIKTRYAGIDLNPNYIGVSVFDGSKLVSTKLFDLKSLTGKNKSEDKITAETNEVAHSIGKYLKHLQVSTVICEKLSFKSGDSGLGKNFNRLTKNQWKRSSFTDILEKYYKLVYVNAAYSSTIGNVLNRNLPDPVAASTEIARRGYEVVIKKSKKFYPELPSSLYLADHWKETEILDFNSWKELHDFLKNTKLKYRVPLPLEESFRKFVSQKSSVYVVDDFVYK